MAEKKCFEFIVKDNVQSVGLRLAIAKLVPDELDVRADNLPGSSVRVVVRGRKRDVIKFWEELQKQVLSKAKNPNFSEGQAAAKTPIDTDRFFHKLQCEQMEKFVDVGLAMKNSIDGMGGKIDGVSGKIDGMSGKIDHMSGNIDNMNSSIQGMSSKLDSIDTKLDTLPKNMAKEIVNLKKSGFL